MSEGADAADGEPVRIAMWSGPRNLSTALMRSFGNRPDCAVSDEPFYAAYLQISGLDHPMRAEILRHHETDWRKVDAALAGPPPDGRPLWYQKHMTHHMLPEIGRELHARLPARLPDPPPGAGALLLCRQARGGRLSTTSASRQQEALFEEAAVDRRRRRRR